MATPNSPLFTAVLGGALKSAIRSGLQQLAANPQFIQHASRAMYDGENSSGVEWAKLPPGDRALWELRVRRVIDAFAGAVG